MPEERGVYECSEARGVTCPACGGVPVLPLPRGSSERGLLLIRRGLGLLPGELGGVGEGVLQVLETLVAWMSARVRGG